jgi:hypothetical protein
MELGNTLYRTHGLQNGSGREPKKKILLVLEI